MSKHGLIVEDDEAARNLLQSFFLEKKFVTKPYELETLYKTALQYFT